MNLEVITGIIAGIVSGAGMGGGAILILILVNFMQVDQHIAQATNLIFFIPTALVAIWVNYRQKLIDFKLGTIIAIAGILGAIVGAKLSLVVDSTNLKRYFGIFLLIIAFYEAYSMIKMYKKNKKTNNTKD